MRNTQMLFRRSMGHLEKTYITGRIWYLACHMGIDVGGASGFDIDVLGTHNDWGDLHERVYEEMRYDFLSLGIRSLGIRKRGSEGLLCPSVLGSSGFVFTFLDKLDLPVIRARQTFLLTFPLRFLWCRITKSIISTRSYMYEYHTLSDYQSRLPWEPCSGNHRSTPP